MPGQPGVASRAWFCLDRASGTASLPALYRRNAREPDWRLFSILGARWASVVVQVKLTIVRADDGGTDAALPALKVAVVQKLRDLARQFFILLLRQKKSALHISGELHGFTHALEEIPCLQRGFHSVCIRCVEIEDVHFIVNGSLVVGQRSQRSTPCSP